MGKSVQFLCEKVGLYAQKWLTKLWLVYMFVSFK